MIKNIRFNSKLIIITILSFITYILANGVWCIPLLAWIYPVLFLWLIRCLHNTKIPYCFSKLLFMEGAEFTLDVFRKLDSRQVSDHHVIIHTMALRWNAQRGVVIIPKSTHKERMEENFNVWN